MTKLLKPSRRLFLQSTGLAAGGLLGISSGLRSAAWAQSSSDLLAAAKAEGKVVLYTGSSEPIIIALGEAFQAEYGIQLEYQRLNSSDIGARYAAEAAAGRTIADVVMAGDALLFEEFHSRNWLADLDPAEIAGLDAWPADLRNDYSAVISINAQTMGINTDQVPDAPTKWEDMLKPEFKGRIITQDLTQVGLVAFAAYDMILTNYGEDFLRAFGQQELILGSGGPASIQQVAAGGAALFFPCSTSQAFSMINQGAPVAAVLPVDQPYTGVVTPFGISKDAPNPNAARLLGSFLLSEKGQQILNTETVSPNNTPGTAALAPGFVTPDMVSAAANKDKIISLLGLA